MLQLKNNIFFFSKYDSLSASCRERVICYINLLKKKKINTYFYPLINNKLFYERIVLEKSHFFLILFAIIKRILIILFIRKNKNIVIISGGELIPYFPSILESFLLLKGVKYILDFDDAVFHNYENSNNLLTKFLLKNKFKVIFKNSHAVFAGNKYIYNYALENGARKVIYLPTTIDFKKYEINTIKRISNLKKKDSFKLVWIGSPSTTKYLNSIITPLKYLINNYNISLRVIGSKNFSFNSSKVEIFDWNEKLQYKYILECDVGLMPLNNGSWEKGKCGYKIIQYMYCSIPVIVSPVGANLDIVKNQFNGLFANSNSEWIKSVLALKNNKDLYNSIKENGKKEVERRYSFKTRSNSFLQAIDSE